MSEARPGHEVTVFETYRHHAVIYLKIRVFARYDNYTSRPK